jgi:hypothetical protein
MVGILEKMSKIIKAAYEAAAQGDTSLLSEVYQNVENLATSYGVAKEFEWLTLKHLDIEKATDLKKWPELVAVYYTARNYKIAELLQIAEVLRNEKNLN